jgi:hypothetical protein
MMRERERERPKTKQNITKQSIAKHSIAKQSKTNQANITRKQKDGSRVSPGCGEHDVDEDPPKRRNKEDGALTVERTWFRRQTNPQERIELT